MVMDEIVQNMEISLLKIALYIATFSLKV